MVRVLASHQCGPGATPGITDAIMWLEFVVGSLPCFERVFSRYYGFPLSLKTNTSKFQFNWNAQKSFNDFLRTLTYELRWLTNYKQNTTNYNYNSDNRSMLRA